MKIPLAVPNLLGREAEYLQKCIETTFVSSVGPFVDQLESQISTVSGANGAVLLCSGTTALNLAYEALGVGSNDLVMIPGLTFIATANAVRHSGADVWIVDSDPKLWSLDLDLCRKAILSETEPHDQGRLHKATGKVLKAITPVMVMGMSLDFDVIGALAREFNLKVVVDAAAAIGAKAKGNIPLAQTGVDAVCYSFNGNKTITCGGGGAIASHNADLIAKIRHLSTTGRVGRNYDHDIVAYNYRMTNVQAALGVAQFERIESFLQRKAEIHHAYTAFAAEFSCLEGFPVPDFGQSTFWFSGFYYTGERLELCDAFRAHMNEAGVDLRKFWKPIHLQTPYADALATQMPVANALWQRIFPLPCSTHLTEDELTKVLSASRQFWDNASG